MFLLLDDPVPPKYPPIAIISLDYCQGMSRVSMIPQTRQSCACIRALVFLGMLLPSSSFFFRRIPPLEQELGCSPTLSRVLGKENYFFDPLSFASDENFARYREAELKHGRVAMLAIIGMVAPGVKGKSLTALEVLKSLKPSQYLEILGTCAFLEAFVFVQQDAKDMPGDYGTGYFGLRDKGRHEGSLVSELENGRLAMLAFAVQVVSEVVTKKGIVEQWEGILGLALHSSQQSQT